MTIGIEKSARTRLISHHGRKYLVPGIKKIVYLYCMYTFFTFTTPFSSSFFTPPLPTTSNNITQYQSWATKAMKQCDEALNASSLQFLCPC
jgi:hypothetical protein